MADARVLCLVRKTRSCPHFQLALCLCICARHMNGAGGVQPLLMKWPGEEVGQLFAGYFRKWVEDIYRYYIGGPTASGSLCWKCLQRDVFTFFFEDTRLK